MDVSIQEYTSSMTVEDLSKRWRLSIYQAALNLKATTKNLTRSEIMALVKIQS